MTPATTSSAFLTDPRSAEPRHDTAAASSRPKPSRFARAFDALAMATHPLILRLFGYRCRVGRDDALRDDGRRVWREVWGAKALLPPDDIASYGERHDAGTTWIVAYHRGRPVGVMGLLDMRVGSIACEVSRRLVPPELDLEKTREICRLAIVKEHRGGTQLVMVGLLREMLAWSKAHGIELLFSGSTLALYRAYQRFNPTAHLVDPPPDPSVDPVRDRYYEKTRAYARNDDVLYTYEVAGASPWSVFSRFLTRHLKGGR